MYKNLADYLASTISDLYWTDERLGKYGEKLTERNLKLINILGCKGKVLKNIYIPKGNGETTEIDLIYITPKGLFVIESKNYSGWIFGDINSQYWTSCLPNGDKNRFYSPVRQNAAHIKWLTEHMAGYTTANIPMFSLIVFSERCELKKVPDDTSDLIICKRNELFLKIRKLWNGLPDILTEHDIEITHHLLVGLTDVSEAEKQAHIDNIRKKTEKSDPLPSIVGNAAAKAAPDETMTCPKCGSPLVLRTAKKGTNTGKQFYGCSGFPKCRYIRIL